MGDGTFTYTYSAAGRLVRAQSVSVTLVYTYTADGLRVAQSVDGDVTEFAWDWATGIPEMLSDGEDLYLVGHDTLGRWDGAAWVYYLSDALGSARQEVDAAGAVTSNREWTPYGVEVGTAQAGLGYAGEWFDGSAGLLYLRARWLDPFTSRFPTRDPWPGVQQHPMSFQPYMYANNNPVRYVDPLGLYSCLTDNQWAPELIGLCILLDSSPEARNVFYRNGILVGLGVVGWRDTEVLFGHWLGGTGETMYFGSRLVELIERDTASLIEESRKHYLSVAAQQMNGEAGRMPPGHAERFLSNASGIPASYAPNPYPISTEVFIALGGVWFERYYEGTVREETPGKYRISLWTDFSIDKLWSFRPNREMYPDLDPSEIPENPPAEFNIADRIGIPHWLPRPVLVHSPVWALFEHLLGARIPIATGNPWSVYIPDEWGYAMEQDGYAAPFKVSGYWGRHEEFLAVDHNCDGWDLGDIVGKPKVTFEMLPLDDDPAPTAIYLHPGVK